METVTLKGQYKSTGGRLAKSESDLTATGFESVVFTIEKAQAIMDNYFGVPADCDCGRKPMKRNKLVIAQDMFYTFPENSEYGLSDCGKVTKGGEFTVTALAISTGKPEKKPTKVVATGKTKPTTEA